MNKYILKTLLCSALVAPVFTSCELDQFPETSLPIEESWQTVKDATTYNNGLLASIRGVTGGGYATVSEAQADLFNLVNKGTSFSQVYSWTFTNSMFDGDGVWVGNYNLIANANNVINNIDKVVCETAEDSVLVKNYKATAYFARAYAYGNMVTHYCKNYDPATAENTLGLPICTTVDVNAKPARASLADTYKFIKEDIQKAKELFQDKGDMDYAVPTYNTVTALEARINLQTQDYDGAIAAAKSLIAQYPLYTAEEAEDFANMWAVDDGQEIIYQPVQTLEERTNSFGIFISYSEQVDMFSPQYIPTQGLLNLYEDNDIRKGIFFAQTGAVAGDVVDEEAIILAKFPGNEALKDQPHDFYNMTKAFRVAEMYLIAAEAQYRKDGTGVEFLNQLREARGASEVKATGLPLFQEIKNEWAREMCGEGQRLDCLKRWNAGFTRMAPQPVTAGFLTDQSGYLDLTVKADNKRFVWEIPANDLQANKNLIRNWAEEK